MGRVTENRRNSFPGKGLRLSTKDSKNKYIIKRRDNELLYAALLRGILCVDRCPPAFTETQQSCFSRGKCPRSLLKTLLVSNFTRCRKIKWKWNDFSISRTIQSDVAIFWTRTCENATILIFIITHYWIGKIIPLPLSHLKYNIRNIIC